MKRFALSLSPREITKKTFNSTSELQPPQTQGAKNSQIRARSRSPPSEQTEIHSFSFLHPEDDLSTGLLPNQWIRENLATLWGGGGGTLPTEQVTRAGRFLPALVNLSIFKIPLLPRV